MKGQQGTTVDARGETPSLDKISHDGTENTPHISNRSKDLCRQEQQEATTYSTRPSSSGGETVPTGSLDRIDEMDHDANDANKNGNGNGNENENGNGNESASSISADDNYYKVLSNFEDDFELSDYKNEDPLGVSDDDSTASDGTGSDGDDHGYTTQSGRRIKSTRSKDFLYEKPKRQRRRQRRKQRSRCKTKELAAAILLSKCDKISDQFHTKMKDLDELQLLSAEVQCKNSSHV